MTTMCVSGRMFFLVLAHPGCTGQNSESRKMVVVVVISLIHAMPEHFSLDSCRLC